MASIQAEVAPCGIDDPAPKCTLPHTKKWSSLPDLKPGVMIRLDLGDKDP